MGTWIFEGDACLIDKPIFLYINPHPAHANWARAIEAEFVQDEIWKYISYESMWSKFKLRIDVKRLIESRYVAVFFLLMMDLNFYLKGIRFILKFARMRPKTILVEDSYASMYIGWALGKILGCRHVQILADPTYFEFEKWGALRNIYLRVLSECDAIITVSNLMREILPESVRSRVRVVAPGYRDWGFESTLKCPDMLQLGVKRRSKGTDAAVRIHDMVMTQYPDSKLYLIGKDGGEFSASELNHENVFVVDYVKNFEEYVKDATFYIHMSRFDPCPVAVMEAMRAGMIPIVSKGCGTKDFVSEVSENLVVESEEEAAELILHLIKDKSLAKRLSQKSKDVISNWGLEKSAEKFKKHFYEVLGEHQSEK